MAKNGKFLEPLALHVAGGKSIADAAAEIGCSLSHGYTLSSSPEFRQRVSEIRSAALDSAVGEITSACVLAVRKLVELLNDPHSAVQAAKAILVHVAPLTDLGEVRSRLDALEQQSPTSHLKVAQ